MDDHLGKAHGFSQLDVIERIFDDDDDDDDKLGDDEIEYRRRLGGLRRSLAGSDTTADTGADTGATPTPTTTTTSNTVDDTSSISGDSVRSQRKRKEQASPELQEVSRDTFLKRRRQGEKGTHESEPALSSSTSLDRKRPGRPAKTRAVTDVANMAPTSEAPQLPKLTRSQTADAARSTSTSTSTSRSRKLPKSCLRSSSPAQPTRGKRKRQTSDAIPEAQQIFRGLRFYYMPDDDVAPKRKLRIGRARAYGAEWTRSMADATHVVVDEALRWGDVEAFVERGLESRTKGGNEEAVVLVSEEFPMDCIVFKRVLPHDQPKYRVRGGPSTVGGDAGKDVKEDDEVETISKTTTKTTTTTTPTPSQEPPSSPGVFSSPAVQPFIPRASSTVIPDSDVEEETLTTVDGGDDDDNAFKAQEDDAGELAEDELAEYIELMKQYDHLPLDEEGEEDDDDEGKGGEDDKGEDYKIEDYKGEAYKIEDHNNKDKGEDHSKDDPDSDSCASDGERERKKAKLARSMAHKHKRTRFQERFACQQGGTATGSRDASNPNARTIRILQDMCDYYARTNDQWRTLSYRRAISTLRRHTSAKITTRQQARALPGVGERLAEKIEEIATTDGLRRLDSARADPLMDVMGLFLGVYGVVTAVAARWIAQGMRSLDDIRDRAWDGLTAHQRMGVERYDDLNTRIPRKEVETLAGIVQDAARTVEPEVEMIVAGSYRRGAESSGDVDFLVTRKGTRSPSELVGFLESLVERLTDEGVLVYTLVSTLDSASSSPTTQKWHGCAVIPGSTGSSKGGPIWRRVDFLLVPDSERGAAMLYFTGNDVFNRSMRLLASRKGMRLNQRGLYSGVMRGPGRKKISQGELVEARSERRIFDVLGVKWREPWERWC